ncbi:PucR family transcriptional regulator [Streptomyces sp. NPDC059373]
MSVEQIQTLVDALATRLGRAVVVDDQDLRLIAASKDYGNADPARMWSLLHRRTRPEDVRYEEIRRWTGPGHIPENAALELWRRLCVPVRCRGLLLGFLWVTDRYGDLTEAQVAEAARAAEVMGRALQRGLVATGEETELRRRLVEQLLSHDPVVRREAWEEALDRGLLDSVGQVAVLLVSCRPGKGDGTPADTRAVLAESMGRLCRTAPGEAALAAVGSRRATVVLARRQGFGDGRLAEAAAALLAELTDRSGLAGCWRVGTSGPVRGLDGLPQAQRQAEVALSAAGEGGAASWPALSADALLAQLVPQAWESALLPEGLAALLADPSAAVLVPTLETYLDCAGDLQRAARELRVHRTTLDYRLERAEHISGMSLHDGRDRLLLHMALGLRRLHGTHQLPGPPADVDVLPPEKRRRAG